MVLAAITPAAQSELKRMGVSIAIVTSSTGTQVRDSVDSSPENRLPLSSFFGDPSRKLYDALGAKYGVSNTILPGFGPLLQHLGIFFDLVVLGAVLGAKKQSLTNPEAAWQQGMDGQ